MRRPSVLFINRVYPSVRGATGRLLRDLARAFAREGWRVTVVTSGPKPAKERDNGVRVIRVKGAEKPSGMFGYIAVWVRLWLAALRETDSQLVVSMSDPPLLAIVGDMVAKAKGCAHIHWCQDLYPDLFPALGIGFPKVILALLKSQVRKAMRACDRVVVIGRCMGKRLVTDGFDPRQVSFIPNWPDFELMRDTDSAMPMSTEPRFRVMYAGSLGLAHPLETILEAAVILQRDAPAVEFVFVGEGERYDWLAEERARRGLDNIKLMPYQPIEMLRPLIESGDVHLISMEEEAAGMLVPCKLYSALVVARPCVFIGPVQSETAKVISDFRAGAIVAQGEPASLAACIRHYVEDSEAWYKASKGARRAGEVFVPKEAINAWIERAWAVIGER